MYELAESLLARAGYEHYEISNWALPGAPASTTSPTGATVAGLELAPAPIHRWAGYRFSTALSPRGYIHRVEQARLREHETADGRIFAGMEQVVWNERVDEAMAMSDGAILGLRLMDGVSLDAYRARYGHDLLKLFPAEIETSVEDGLLEHAGRRLRLTDRGRMLANEVFTRLLPKQEALESR